MHKPESFQKKEAHKLLWDFEIQMDLLSSTRRPDLVIVNKKKKKKKEKKKKRTCRILDFSGLVDHRMKFKEIERKDKYLEPTKELKINHEVDGDTNCGFCTWNNPQRIGKASKRLGKLSRQKH